MSRLRQPPERHFINRTGWLRAAVLGANDGILSTASLIVGVAAAAATQHDILVAGVAGLVAGAMSMAAGEYVSVSPTFPTRRKKQIGSRGVWLKFPLHSVCGGAGGCGWRGDAGRRLRR
jgi:VIT family